MAGLYIHVPFCIRKCPYCDFYSVPVDVASGLVKAYLDGIRAELSRWPDDFSARTIYIGGGTPTALDARALSDLLEAVRPFAPQASEWTVEINPGTMDTEKARLLCEAGVTRVSLGAQSVNDEVLRRLGRIHSARDVYSAFEMLRAAGLDNIGLDLMYGVPGQALSWVEQDLNEMTRLRPEHLSCYALSFEEGTPFDLQRRSGQIEAVSDDLQREQYDRIRDLLKEQGYAHYEISNFARPGRECRHNVAYWLGEEYIGCGPGAHSHWRGERWGHVRNVAEWARRVEGGESPREFSERLAPDAKARETLVLNLRLLGGVTREDFRQRTGYDYFDVAGPALRRLIGEGWLVEEENRLRLAERALFVSNAVFAELV
jgi:oxygen-independent coproporphyrinogen-3 oxidase